MGLSVEDSLGPFVIKMHVPGVRQEKGRTGQAQKDDEPEQENSGKEIVTRHEGVPGPVFETLHGRQSSMSRAPSGVIPRDSLLPPWLLAGPGGVLRVLEILKSPLAGIDAALNRHVPRWISWIAIKQTIENRK